jgi:hypothetical protein
MAEIYNSTNRRLATHLPTAEPVGPQRKKNARLIYLDGTTVRSKPSEGRRNVKGSRLAGLNSAFKML